MNVHYDHTFTENKSEPLNEDSIKPLIPFDYELVDPNEQSKQITVKHQILN